MFVSYTVRNLIARRSATVPTVLVIAATVGVVTSLLGVLEGLSDMVKVGGNPRNATVLSKSVRSDVDSSIPFALAGSVKADAAIDHDLVSPEFVTSLFVRGARTVDARLVNLRGVDPIAYTLHGATVTSGAMPASGASGILVGAQLLGRFPSLREGGTLQIGRNRWPIVGTFSAPSTPYESELWCDRGALMAAFRRQPLSSLAVRLTSGDDQAAFKARVERLDSTVVVRSEPEERQRQLKSVSSFIGAIVIIILLLSIGAIITCLGALYTSFLGRLRELATLYVVGYKRITLGFLIVQEGIALAIVGGVVGVLASLAVNGMKIPVDESAGVLYATIHVSPRVLAAGLVLSLLMGALGSIVAVVHAMYVSMLDALHK